MILIKGDDASSELQHLMENKKEAKVMAPIDKEFREVDPMALILNSRAYLIWWELHNPQPNLEEIRQLIESMSLENRESTLAKAKAIAGQGKELFEFGNIVEKCLTEAGGGIKLPSKTDKAMKLIDKELRTVDPMSLILSSKSYLNWWEIHNLQPSADEVKLLIEKMTHEEREFAFANAKAAVVRGKLLEEYGKAVEAVIMQMEGTNV